MSNDSTTKQEVISHADISEARSRVLQVAQDFKNSWRKLAQALNVVFIHKMYKYWGYDNFDQYTAKEIRIRKHTAMKLIRSYQFLKQEEPRYLEDKTLREEALPSLETVETLAKAKKNLDAPEYKKIKQYLLKDEKPVNEVKKDIASLIRERKDVDPEVERVRGSKTAIKRFLDNLRNFKKEIEIAHILPGDIASDIDLLISKIQARLAEDKEYAQLLK